MNINFAAGSVFKARGVAGLAFAPNEGALSDEQLYARAPSIFAAGRHESRTERYTYIPTIDVVRGLRDVGFFPVAAAQGRSKVPGKAAFTKHLVRFRQEMDFDADWGGAVPEVVMVNSHDGTSSYWLLEGAFRPLCKNGNILAVGEVHGLKVGHSGKIIEKVVEGSHRIIRSAIEQVKVTQEWARIELNPPQRLAFARAAAQLRWDPARQPVAAQDVIQVRRQGDESNDLWTVFNRAQESLIRGGIEYTTRTVVPETQRVITRQLEARPVNGIDQTVGLNAALWTLGAEMARLVRSGALAA